MNLEGTCCRCRLKTNIKVKGTLVAAKALLRSATLAYASVIRVTAETAALPFAILHQVIIDTLVFPRSSMKPEDMPMDKSEDYRPSPIVSAIIRLEIPSGLE